MTHPASSQRAQAKLASLLALQARQDLRRLQEKVMFGSDYPFVQPVESERGLAAAHFPAAQLEQINRGNALRLLPRIAAQKVART